MQEQIPNKKHQFSNKELALLLIPLMLESALNMLIGMCDTIMVSSNGEAAVSGVSLIDTLSNLFMALFSAASTGGAVVCSQYLGKKEGENAKETAKNLVFLSAISGIAIALIIIPLKMQIIDVFFGKIASDVRVYSGQYFSFIALSYPFLAVYQALAAVCRSESKTERTFVVALIMNIINIGGNAILIFGLGLGPRGAGIASLASRIFGAVALFVLLLKKDEELSIAGISHLRPNAFLMGRIMKIALPSGIEGSLFHVGKIMIASLVTSLGTSSVAINAVIGNYNMYANIPGAAINLSIITVIGQCRGANNFRDIKYYNNKLLAIVYVSTFIVCLPLYIWSPQVIALYGLEAESIAIAVPIARRCLIACFLLWPPSFSTPNVLKAVGDAEYTMVVSFSSMWICRVFGAYVFVKGFGLGVEGIWFAMYLDWVARGTFYLTRYYSGKWKTKRLLED